MEQAEETGLEIFLKIVSEGKYSAGTPVLQPTLGITQKFARLNSVLNEAKHLSFNGERAGLCDVFLSKLEFSKELRSWLMQALADHGPEKIAATLLFFKNQK